MKGNELYELRTGLDLTQEQFGEKICKCRQAISNYEIDYRPIPKNVERMIELVFGADKKG